MISDSLRSYHRLMKELKVDWKKIPSKKNSIDGYTLDKTNGLHSSIKHYLYSMRGVGAKYLQNYVSLFVYQWEQGEVSSYEIALDLFKELNWNYQGTRNRNFTIQVTAIYLSILCVSRLPIRKLYLTNKIHADLKLKYIFF